MKKKLNGFTFIELIIFIIVTGILASTILLTFVGSLNNAPIILKNTIAAQTVKQCAEWYLGQRRLNGYTNLSGANCAGTLSIPSFCSTPSGYTISGTCSQTTLSSDNQYETITLTVGGAGNAALTLLLGNY